MPSIQSEFDSIHDFLSLNDFLNERDIGLSCSYTQDVEVMRDALVNAIMEHRRFPEQFRDKFGEKYTLELQQDEVLNVLYLKQV